jgi:hypothetical protein
MSCVPKDTLLPPSSLLVMLREFVFFLVPPPFLRALPSYISFTHSDSSFFLPFTLYGAAPERTLPPRCCRRNAMLRDYAARCTSGAFFVRDLASAILVEAFHGWSRVLYARF